MFSMLINGNKIGKGLMLCKAQNERNVRRVGNNKPNFQTSLRRRKDMRPLKKDEKRDLEKIL